MLRSVVLLSAIVATLAVEPLPRTAAWPHLARVTSPSGRPVAFSAITLGGALVFSANGMPESRRLLKLARGDTLRATTPATYSLDMTSGPVTFFASRGDSIRVVVARNPYGWGERDTAQGRRLTVRLVRGRAVVTAP